MSSTERLKRLKKNKSKSGQTIYSKRRVWPLLEFLRIQELRNKKNQSAKNQKK